MSDSLPPTTPDDQAERFQRQAEQMSPSLAAEFLHFLAHNKKWWLTPIIVVLLLVAAMIVLASLGGAPFIYPL
jgi:hypothetical protein